MSRTPLILSVFSTFATGGPQVRFASIANHFGSDWRHMVVAMDGNLAARERLDAGLDVSFPQLGLTKGDTRGNIGLIRAALRDIRPDALVTNNWGSIEWAMANAVAPLVRHVHIEDGFGPEERDRQIARRVWMRRLVLRRNATILPSQTLMSIARDIWRLPERRLHYVPNGIDLARFTPVARDPTRALPVIGTIAALRAEKNIARLLRAFRLVLDRAPARLMIVGDGPLAPALRALAAELGLHDAVEFTGHQADPRAALAEFDIFALSSDTEQMPISLLEAMAAGLPVAATHVGDVANMLAPENRALVVPCDDVALAGAMTALVQDRALRANIGTANRHNVTERFAQEAMFAAYSDLLLPIFSG